jgi:hypothetical protein
VAACGDDTAGEVEERGAVQVECARPSERYAGTEEELAQCLLDAGL